MAPKRESGKLVAENRKARFNYDIEEKLEAGIALTGSEVKSLRAGKANIAESYASDERGELYLVNAHIAEYSGAARDGHAPTRPRKLLLHAREIARLLGAIQRHGMTVVPLRLYFNARGIAKVELGLAKGKKLHDKRETEKKRDWDRQKGRLMREKGMRWRRAGLPQATDDGDAFHLTPGTNVPPVVPATDGTAVNLAALRGRSIVVVYPWTGRPGFPNPPDWDLIPGAHGRRPSSRAFATFMAISRKQGLRLFGLSRQDTAYQRELVARLGLPFPILSDEAGAFAPRWNRSRPSQPAMRTTYSKRLTLIVDRRTHRAGFLSGHRPGGPRREVCSELKPKAR